MNALNLRERRRAFRVTPNPLAVINFPSGNCAVVLDISSNGLGFLAASPLEDVYPRDFRLSFKSIEGAEAAGELIWQDPSGKRGGVRFTHLPEVIREQLAVWLRQPQVQAVASADAALDEAEGAVFTRRNSPSFTESDPLFPEDKVAPRTSTAINVLTFALALIVALGVWSSIYRQESREAWTRLRVMNLRGLRSFSVVPTWIRVRYPARAPAEPLNTSSADPSPSMVSAPAPTAIQWQAAAMMPGAVHMAATSLLKPAPSTKKTAVPSQKESLQYPSARQKPSPDVSLQNASSNDAASPDVKGQAELALARGYLQGEESEQDIAKAVPLLWLAVQKGNTDAEVDLADLYVRGAGVPRSCEQARVLLTAAAKSEGVLAGKKLSELDDRCR